MFSRVLKLGRSVPSDRFFIRKFSCSGCSITSLQDLQQALAVTVRTRSYQQIPDLLNFAGDHFPNPNLFSFLAEFPDSSRIHIIDEILQAFIPLRPRSRNRAAYSCLLSHTLQSPNPFPLSLAIVQRSLRSGCSPFPEASVLLSAAWLKHCRDSRSVAEIMLGMKSIGYSPDTGTCNYVISSLSSADRLDEAMKVLKGMGGAGCIPDSDTYGMIIGRMCDARRCSAALEMLKKMVKAGLTPRQGTVEKVAAALKASREVRKGVDMIGFLEKEECSVGFEVYEIAAEACLEGKEPILAAKVVMRMTNRGFIPYIKVRQMLVEGLASKGELGLVHAIRQRLTELGS
ncbi:pentatricopeptide repeat-containing protein At1g06270 [Punica granatum]|uniref:Uncharacterized protein n=2 Tax=Punica granatum TaxID=22663 RepID=A0A218XMF0_PUNGR|nr:pentatricopeptide repeat-containing protein At1g06270 [Punica granatum]OWM85970.1 hypothetical protein CDL15_Pgr012220 [Punica granatum]PKI35735.1 hypothetical protein CRG98_043893 [Punica granatum]